MTPAPQKDAGTYVYSHADMRTVADQQKRRGIRVPPREILDDVKKNPITATSTLADVKALVDATAAIPNGQGFWHDTEYDGDWWCIYGHEYDFTPFLTRHPGGQMMLKLGQGCDCTCMFETYHVMKNHKQLLSMIEQYRMHKTIEGQAVPKPLVPQNDFLEDCKAMMKDHFVTGEGAKEKYPAQHKPSWTRFFWLYAPAFITAALFWQTWSAGKWWCFTIMIAQWLIGVNTSHDGGHHAMSTRPYVNMAYLLLSLPVGYHPWVWMHQHDIMHHQNPNDVGRDVDLDHFHPMRLSPRQSHKYKNLAAHILRYSYSSFYLCVGYPLWWVGIQLPFPALKPLGLEKQFKKPVNVAIGAFSVAVSLFVVAQPFYHFAFGDYSLFKAAFFALFPWAGAAIIFICFTQVNHLQAECFLPAVLDEPNAMKRQVTTAMDYKQDAMFWQVMTGGINIQSMHHCFPSVCSANFVDVYPKFVEVCRKHNCAINMKASWIEAMTGMLSHMWNLNTGDFAIEL